MIERDIFLAIIELSVVSSDCCSGIGCVVECGLLVWSAEADHGRPGWVLLPEPVCSDAGKRGHGNLTVTARYGPGQTRRMPRCRTRKGRFSERKGAPPFDARLPPAKVNDVLARVAEGVGTRKTARLAGDRAEPLHDELVPFSPEDR